MDGYIFPNEAELQWSILIVLYPFITGLVAGAFVVSSLYHVFGMQVLRPVARLALVTALAFLLVAPLPLQAHLGRPERAFLIFLTPQFTSAMAGFGYIWMAYLVLVVVETWLVFRPDIVALAQRSRWPLRPVYQSMALGVDDVSEEALAVDHRLIKVLAAVGIPAAALLHGYVGFIFGAIKANPWWSTPLMPIIFLLSAIVSGIALLIVLYVVSMKLLERPVDHACVRAMGGLLAAFLLIDLTLEGLEILSMAYEQEESWDMVRGLIDRIAVTFIGVQIVLGALVPASILGLVLLLRPARGLATALTTLCGALVVVGVFAMRWNVVVGGQLISKSLRGYVEYEWIIGGREGVMVAGMVLLLPLIIYAVLVTLLPPWVPAEAEEAAPAPVPAPALSPVWARRRTPRFVPLKLTLVALPAAMGALVLGALVLPGSPRLLELGGSQPERVLVPDVRSAFPAALVESFTEPVGGSWVEPLDLAVIGERTFVLDHSGLQVIEVDAGGNFVRYYSELTTPGLELHHPHAMVTDGRLVYIGNTFPPRIYVLDPDRGLVRTIELPPGQIENLPTVPTGLALTAAGDLVVADGQNHRVLVVSPEGETVRIVQRTPGSWDLVAPQTASDARSGGPNYPMSAIATMGRPGSVGVAADGTILALDILDAGVTRVGADGKPAGVFARPDDMTGGVFRPTDIAVDALGRMYIADDLIGGIQVYAPDGVPLGIIGRSDPNSFTESSAVSHPSALAVQDNRLYVIDRGRALLVYQIPGLDAAARTEP